MKMNKCNNCGYDDVRKAGTDCPICKMGVMKQGEK